MLCLAQDVSLQMARDRTGDRISALRKEISSDGSTVVTLCSLYEDEISAHFRRFTPVCDLLRAIVEDDKGLPAVVSRVEREISEMSRRMNPGDLDEVVSVTFLRMVYRFVRLTNTKADPVAASTRSDVEAHYESLKKQVFDLSAENERLKQERAEERTLIEHQFRSVMSGFCGGGEEDDRKKKKKQQQQQNKSDGGALVQLPPNLVSPTPMQALPKERGKKTIQAVRTTTTTQEATPSVVSPTPLTVQAQPTSQSSQPRGKRKMIRITTSVERAPIPLPCTPAPLSLVMEEEQEQEEEEGTATKRICGKSSAQAQRASSFVCPFDDCDRPFNRIVTLMEHTMSDHYWQGAVELHCSVCGQCFDNERTFDNHLLSCAFGKVDVAVKKWGNEETTAEKEERLRMEQTLLSCPYPDCNYVSKSKGRTILKHLTKSHNDNVASYRCECGKSRRTLYTMLFHRYSECPQGRIEWTIAGAADGSEEKGVDVA